MKVFEQIQIRGEPFPKPLPLPANELFAMLKKHGQTFYFEDGVLRHRDEFDPNRLESVKKIMIDNNLTVNVQRHIWVVYDDRDFENAPLWCVGVPSEIWVSGIDFYVTCDVCGRKDVHVDSDVHVQSVNTRKPIVSVNGQFTIVRSDVASRMEKELKGVKLPPFDEEGRYHYLLATCELRDLIVGADQALGFRGRCEKCSLPIFEKPGHFGPLRYPSNQWKGEDIVNCDLLLRHAYTPKAFELVRKFEKKLVRDGIVLLEGREM